MRSVNVGFTFLAALLAVGVVNLTLPTGALACDGKECGDCDKEKKTCPHGKKHKKGKKKCDCSEEHAEGESKSEGSAEKSE